MKEKKIIRDAIIKLIMVTTGIDNHLAKHLYRKTLNVSVEASIKDVYFSDELILLGRK